MRVECSSVRNVRRMWLLDPKGGGGGLGEDDFRLLDFCERFFFFAFLFVSVGFVMWEEEISSSSSSSSSSKPPPPPRFFLFFF